MSRVARLVLGLVAALAVACGSPSGGPGDFQEIPGIGATRVDVPRPAGPSSAACDADPLPPSTDATTEARVAALRDAGLFADRATLTDAELARDVDASIEERWSGSLQPDDPLRDLAIAEQDHARVLWIDLEADVAEANDVYVGLIGDLAAISVGDFSPVDVVESWDSDTGPIRVEFSTESGPQVLEPAYLEDWIDPMILMPLNGMIVDTGRRFELYRAFDQTALIVAVTDPDRVALERLGWCFE